MEKYGTILDSLEEKIAVIFQELTASATPETKGAIKEAIMSVAAALEELERARGAVLGLYEEIDDMRLDIDAKRSELEYHSCVSAEKMKSEALKREKESKRMLHEASLERRSAAVIMAGARRKIKSFSMVVDRLVELEHQNMPDAERKRYDAITGGNSQSLLRRIILQKYDLSECSKGNTA